MKTLHLILLLAVLPIGGCSYTAAERARGSMEASAISYDANMNRLLEGFIADFRTQAQAKADELAGAAIKAEIGADGKANAINLQIILAKKAEQYQVIEQRVIDMRRKIIAAHKDMDHLLAYSAALKEYFKASTSTAELLNQSSEQVIGMLDQFVKGKTAPKTTSVPAPSFLAP